MSTYHRGMSTLIFAWSSIHNSKVIQAAQVLSSSYFSVEGHLMLISSHRLIFLRHSLTHILLTIFNIIFIYLWMFYIVHVLSVCHFVLSKHICIFFSVRILKYDLGLSTYFMLVKVLYKYECSVHVLLADKEVHNWQLH